MFPRDKLIKQNIWVFQNQWHVNAGCHYVTAKYVVASNIPLMIVVIVFLITMLYLTFYQISLVIKLNSYMNKIILKTVYREHKELKRTHTCWNILIDLAIFHSSG